MVAGTEGLMVLAMAEVVIVEAFMVVSTVKVEIRVW